VRRYVAARLLQSLIVVVLVATIGFLLIRLAPGDPFAYDLPNVSPAVRAQLRAQFGYDRPLLEQYGRYLGAVAHGDLGYSHSLRAPVREVLASRLPNTLLLMGVAVLISLAAGVVLGALQAAWRDSRFDRWTSGVLLFCYSLPDFWVALLLMLAFALWIPVLPSSGMVDAVMHEMMPPWAAFVDRLRHLVLPVLSLVLGTTAAIARYQRASMLEVLPLDFVRTARAKGLPERLVVGRHALRNALLPIVTLLGLSVPALVGGAVFVETVFGWPGMGALAVTAIGTRDYDLVTASVVVGGVMVVLGNLLADMLYAVVDPRLRG
jgi:peptide/nickel transport system permease protein